MSVAISSASSPYEDHYKEWFSRAFVQAASASAGVSAEWVSNDIYGVDVVLKDSGIAVDAQLKSTASPTFLADGTLSFPLEVGTYNMLRDPGRGARAYLFVAVLGPERAHWLGHHRDSTTILKEARWALLTGLDPSENSATVSVHLPETNVLSARAVRQFILEARDALS